MATIKKWLGEIGSDFYNRTTNGIVKRSKNKLKLLKQRSFEYRNFDNFKIISLLSGHFPDNFAHSVPKNNNLSTQAIAFYIIEKSAGFVE